jgi:hypothetical protein
MNNISTTIKKLILFLKHKTVLSIFCLLILFNLFTLIAYAGASANSTASVIGYTVPDEYGGVILNNTTPQLVVISPEQILNVQVESGTSDPTINLNSLCTGGEATLPAVNISSVSAYGVAVSIPASTNVSTTEPSWNCLISLPTITAVSLPNNQILSEAIEIGFSGARLSFDKAVRIFFPGEAGKRVGYSRTGTDLNEITNICDSDTLDTTINFGNIFPAEGDCKIYVGDDLIIRTKHFTKFFTYTLTSTSHGSSGGFAQVATPSLPLTPVITPTPTETPIRVVIPKVTSLATTIITKSVTKLFDIVLTIENALLNKSSDLIAHTQFTSFGTVPTLVNMVYRIEDASGKEVYTENTNVTVETEQLVTKEFKNLNIKDGKYTLFLTTTYGASVTDEFKQVFEVKTPIAPKKGTATWYIVAGLVVVIGGFEIYMLRRRKIENNLYDKLILKNNYEKK